MKIVCFEFAKNAMPLTEYQQPQNALYIFESENGRISQQVIDRADAVIYVPVNGCMNLAATVNVMLYEDWLNHLKALQAMSTYARAGYQ